MAWEFEADRPIYQQAAEIVRKRIIKGVYPQGSRLPAVRDLAMEAGVNPNTMQRALLLLEESGIVYSQRTAGRFVPEDVQLLENLRYQMARKQVLSFVKRMDELGYGKDYKYAHDYPGHFVDQQYQPDAIAGTRFWQPADNPQEAKMKQHMDALWGAKK